ncbi:Putative stress-induced transcription regulator [Saccharopolyspora antimicrobica]|uniref:Stress-induced transcription regulator n=1 Tax=Saccharopolyspora antimicrobica TaxID=455193 RepID=A0A1I5FK17_9PSEU|nr:CGNR zinc finger domain-containing protein [Saccharopolyspora antimicrobica]RKT82193.1 putative stress-induced transcription regulator [Saccharopolyspora antimicrobica]SFO23966.1 Putative stress-induced transcription regulator [Saccharopolyspora antimicrobica]
MTDPSPQAELIMAFANTVDIEEQTDALADVPGLARWLTETGLTSSTPAVTAEDHQRCLRFRSGVRELLGTEDRQAHVLAEADSVLRELPLLVSATAAGSALQPAPELPTVPRAFGALAAALAVLLITGENERIKRCPAEDCGWVFWDNSKNRSRRWCSMRVCGNRNKARSFAARNRRSPEADR